jgi:hypothetical protein
MNSLCNGFHSVSVGLLIGLAAGCREAPSPFVVGTSKYEIVRKFSSDVIGQVRDVYVEQTGEVWVLSSSPPFLAMFDSTGRLLRSGGVHGRGPTDFLYPFLLVSSRKADQGAIGVVDVGRHLLLYVDTLQQPIRARPLRLIGGVMRADMPMLVPSLPFAVSRAGDAVLAVAVKGSISTEADLSRQEVVRQDGDRTTLVASPSRSRDAAYRWLRTNPLWAACAGRGLIGTDASHRYLMRIDVSGGLDSMRLPELIKRKPLTAAAIRRNLRYHLADEYRQAGKVATDSFLDATTDQFARGYQLSRDDSLPVFSAVLCTDTGLAWLQHFDLNASPVGAGGVWYRQVPAGWERVVLPDGFRPVAVAGNRVTGIFTDSTGLEHVATTSPRR